MRSEVYFPLKFRHSRPLPNPMHEFDERSGRAGMPYRHGKKGAWGACCWVAGQGKGALGGVSALVVWCEGPNTLPRRSIT